MTLSRMTPFARRALRIARTEIVALTALLVVALLILFKWNLIVDLFILVLAVLLLALAANRLMILILGRRAKDDGAGAAAPSGD